MAEGKSFNKQPQNHVEHYRTWKGLISSVEYSTGCAKYVSESITAKCS